MKLLLRILLPTIGLIMTSVVQTGYAHPGNTDSNGCHTCRTNCSNWGFSYGEYHCHNGSSSSSSYTPSYTPPPTCSSQYGYNSVDIGNGQCGCMSGYVFGTDYLGNKQCVSGETFCSNKYGYGTKYDSYSVSCVCKTGYKFNSNGTSCELKNTYNSCPTQGHSTYSPLMDKCECDYGYESSGTEGYCTKKSSISQTGNSDLYYPGVGTYPNPILTGNPTSCGMNSEENSAGRCACKSGYVWAFPDDADNYDCIKKKTGDEICADKYGTNSKSDGVQLANGSYSCTCKEGYEWDSSQTSCIKKKSGYELCVTSFGINSYEYSSGSCACKTGYQFNFDRDQCISSVISTKALNAFSKLNKQFSKLSKAAKIKKLKSAASEMDKISKGLNYTIDQKTQAAETRKMIESEIKRISR